MIYRLLVVTAILFLQINATASPHDKWWEAGNRLYQAKQYDSAAWYFEQIAALKPQDAVVYYNLGNSYYRLNKVGPAVLNYEKALQIKPDYPEAKDNLTLAQSRIVKPIPYAEDIFFVSWWNSLTAQSNMGLWSVISLVLFLAVITIAILKTLGKIGFATRKLQVSLLSLWAVTIIFAFASNGKRAEQRAVMMEEGTPLLNDKKGKSIGNIPEGTTLDIESESGSMLEITLPDGRTGWVNKNTVAKI